MAAFPTYADVGTGNMFTYMNNGLISNVGTTSHMVVKASSFAWPDPRLGQPLTSPRAGMWIIERRAFGAYPRQIVDMQCGQRILTLGKRHSIIEWKNLHRYTEWDLQNNRPRA